MFISGRYLGKFMLLIIHSQYVIEKNEQVNTYFIGCKISYRYLTIPSLFVDSFPLINDVHFNLYLFFCISQWPTKQNKMYYC